MSDSKSSMSGAVLSNDTLWGSRGGQLEYVGQRMVARIKNETSLPQWYVILYFTDHDRWGCGDPSISDEMYAHYSMEVPVSGYNE